MQVHRWLFILVLSCALPACTRYVPKVANPAKHDDGHGHSATKDGPSEDEQVEAALAKLSALDRDLARAQGFCAAETDHRLGLEGPPVKILVKGQPVFLCCASCEADIRKDEDKALRVVAELKEQVAEAAKEKQIRETLAKLEADTRENVELQKFCPIEPDHRLGQLGVPVRIVINDESVYLCCKNCVEAASKAPEKTLAAAQELNIKGNLAKLSPEDRKLALAQRFCAADPEGSRLGSMGPPAKFMIGDQPVFVCCAGCIKPLKKDEAKTLKVVEELRKKHGKAK